MPEATRAVWVDRPRPRDKLADFARSMGLDPAPHLAPLVEFLDSHKGTYTVTGRTMHSPPVQWPGTSPDFVILDEVHELDKERAARLRAHVSHYLDKHPAFPLLPMQFEAFEEGLRYKVGERYGMPEHRPLHPPIKYTDERWYPRPAPDMVLAELHRARACGQVPRLVFVDDPIKDEYTAAMGEAIKDWAK
jgi:hypothetical protein